MDAQFLTRCNHCKKWAFPKLFQTKIDDNHVRTGIACSECENPYWYMEKQTKEYYDTNYGGDQQ